MLLKDFQIRDINSWCSYTVTLGEEVYDIVRINYTSMGIDCTFQYKRYKSLCFYEQFNDYAETYVSDVEFTELKNQLNNVVPYLELYKDIKELKL